MIKLSGKTIAGLVAGTLALGTLFIGTFSLDDGEFAAVRQAGGDVTVYTEPGLHWRTPFITSKNEYTEVSTVCFDQREDDSASLDKDMYSVTFSDTYKVGLNICFRLQMPADPEKIEYINGIAKGKYNLLRNTYAASLTDLMAYTANQFTGEDFMQGGFNEFKNRLSDQARNGLYLTKRVPVEVTRQAANAGVEVDSKQISKGQSIIYKAEIQRDPETNEPLRQESQLATLGVKIVQISITGDPVPEKDLQDFMQKKKDRIRERASIKEEQETERQKAITEQLKGDRERIQAKQKMLREKDAAEIGAAKEIALAKAAAQRETVERQKVADLAKIDKQRELDIAKANEGIQKANSMAAKYEALAIKEKGLAEAVVTKAKYDALAKNKEVYLAEVQRDIAKTMYDNLRNFKVEMPQNYVNGSGGTQMQSNLDVITGFGALGMMEKSQNLSDK
ncbi:hypothetical protein FDJ19_gp152 [Vibrio phage Ceto]|uniref:Band 7 domain-containing protein n=1 Tax=Vibrio phage Ceto TaxID=2570300 RepID=A0A2H5BGM4_9CAUD|nr:hypothetical protein FDJ19_gp152 [Vibrio phage Ceto]AUG85146.1 hypothetical protein CETO_164 [Vibrio phage Ceto]